MFDSLFCWLHVSNQADVARRNRFQRRYSSSRDFYRLDFPIKFYSIWIVLLLRFKRWNISTQSCTFIFWFFSNMERIKQLDFPYHEILNLVYTSNFNDDKYSTVGNLPILPLRTDTKGPAPRFDRGFYYAFYPKLTSRTFRRYSRHCRWSFNLVPSNYFHTFIQNQRKCRSSFDLSLPLHYWVP